MYEAEYVFVYFFLQEKRTSHPPSLLAMLPGAAGVLQLVQALVLQQVASQAEVVWWKTKGNHRWRSNDLGGFARPVIA